ncbi:helix-turn-helix domain-containing protein [Pedobacter sp.]
MERFDRPLFGRNVKILREALGISQHDFSSLIDISKRTLANIEAGATNISIDLLSAISSFFGLSIDSLSDPKLLVPSNFRDKVKELHKNKSAYQIILNKKPNLTFAINQLLLPSSFLNAGREINEVKLFFEKLGWEYLGTSISNALKRQKNKIKIESHPTKKGTFVYSKKPN